MLMRQNSAVILQTIVLSLFNRPNLDADIATNCTTAKLHKKTRNLHSINLLKGYGIFLRTRTRGQNESSVEQHKNAYLSLVSCHGRSFEVNETNAGWMIELFLESKLTQVSVIIIQPNSTYFLFL
jgi:hypothetical protein